MKKRKAQARGAAIVELALGILVFITILTVGIHLAEVGYLQIKVTEASASALWDATHYDHHDWPNDTGPARAAVAQAQASAQARYADFDGRSATNNGTQVKHVFTRVRGMQVQCELGGTGLDFGPNLQTAAAYGDNGGMSCRAQADITAVELPVRFLDQANDGFFQTQNYEPTPIRACSVGRARSGACQGRLVSMVDDWGLTGPSESGMNPVIPNAPSPSGNTPYFLMTAGTFLANGGGMGMNGSRLAQFTVGRMPPGFIYGGEMVPWLSFIGEELLFTQALPTHGDNLWTTTPGGNKGLSAALVYTVSYARRGNCFLGKPCP